MGLYALFKFFLKQSQQILVVQGQLFLNVEAVVKGLFKFHAYIKDYNYLFELFLFIFEINCLLPRTFCVDSTAKLLKKYVNKY